MQTPKPYVCHAGRQGVNLTSHSQLPPSTATTPINHPTTHHPTPPASSADLEAFLRRKYVAKEFASGTWPPPPEAQANCPEVQAILADCLPAERARELAAARQAAAEQQRQQEEAEERRRAEEEAARAKAAAAAAAAAINLMDFDDEASGSADVAGGASVDDSLALAIVDPMKSLEEVFAAPAPQAQQQGKRRGRGRGCRVGG